MRRWVTSQSQLLSDYIRRSQDMSLEDGEKILRELQASTLHHWRLTGEQATKQKAVANLKFVIYYMFMQVRWRSLFHALFSSSCQKHRTRNLS